MPNFIDDWRAQLSRTNSENVAGRMLDSERAERLVDLKARRAKLLEVEASLRTGASLVANEAAVLGVEIEALVEDVQ